MPKINLLSQDISELIAAGEVVERPASVVKEMIENSIDAGARHITVEIKRGGITFIRITDDGCGISFEDTPLAFLRHATSKIKNASDLENISTLGFRGEALAATAAVSRVEIFTKPADSQFGTHYGISGGIEQYYEETGCADGTTIFVKDLFYNTPARMKFLKKDVTEGSAVADVAERAALSHPEIAFKFIRDGKQVMATSGDGKLSSAVYSVLGREFHSTLIPVDSAADGISVTGFVCKPVYCRASRSRQYTFLNGRFVISKTVTAAAEQAYRDSAMVGKFPAFVLCVKIPGETVDVNVHPAKTEVRFSDERRIFSAVHYAVKSAVAAGDTRPQIPTQGTRTQEKFLKMTAEQYRQSAVKLPRQDAFTVGDKIVFHDDTTPFYQREDVKKYIAEHPQANISETLSAGQDSLAYPSPSAPEPASEKPQASKADESETEFSPESEIRLIGEAFSTYIVAQMGDSIYLIDKHAAHERIIYNDLCSADQLQIQTLLLPVTVRLSAEEYSAAVQNTEEFLKAGFEIEDFGNKAVLVRAVPACLDKNDVESVVTEAAASLAGSGSIKIDFLDNLFRTVACKAAIKAGYITSARELFSLAKRILSGNDIMYCPHGRPVAFRVKRGELEKYFGRIQ